MWTMVIKEKHIILVEVGSLVSQQTICKLQWKYSIATKLAICVCTRLFTCCNADASSGVQLSAEAMMALPGFLHLVLKARTLDGVFQLFSRDENEVVKLSLSTFACHNRVAGHFWRLISFGDNFTLQSDGPSCCQHLRRLRSTILWRLAILVIWITMKTVSCLPETYILNRKDKYWVYKKVNTKHTEKQNRLGD